LKTTASLPAHTAKAAPTPGKTVSLRSAAPQRPHNIRRKARRESQPLAKTCNTATEPNYTEASAARDPSQRVKKLDRRNESTSKTFCAEIETEEQDHTEPSERKT
jgi:hypothetical protein